MIQLKDRLGIRTLKTVKTLFSCLAFFAVCDLKAEGLSQNEKNCPAGPSQHLNENFPAEAVILTTSQYSQGDFMKMLGLLLQNRGVSGLKKIIVFDPKKYLDQVSLPPDQVKVFPDAVIWNQDFIEAFVEKTTGRPFVRLISEYKKSGAAGEYQTYRQASGELTGFLKTELGIPRLEDMNLNPGLSQAKNGNAGGNMESTNEGFCMIGTSDLSEDEWKHAADLNCGGPAKTIKLNTSWLPATHVDEMLKQLPETSPACEPRFLVNSMESGIELLKAAPEAPFFKTASSSDEVRMLDQTSMSKVCATVLAGRGDLTGLVQVKDDNGTYYRMPPYDMTNFPLFVKCRSVLNREVSALYENHPYFKKSFADFRGKTGETESALRDFYRKQRPDCRLGFMHVPILFLSGDRPGTADNILPNLINNLKVGRDVFAPDTGNAGFNQSLASSLSPFQLNVNFLTTFGLHAGRGNIHCSSQTVHRCTPAKP